MHFEVLGEIENVVVIAEGGGVRIQRFLRKMYSGRRWRKMKGWYEAHGIGRKGLKISRLLAEE